MIMQFFRFSKQLTELTDRLASRSFTVGLIGHYSVETIE